MHAGKQASSGSARTIVAPTTTGRLKAAVVDSQGAKLMMAESSGPLPKSEHESVALVPLHGLAVYVNTNSRTQSGQVQNMLSTGGSSSQEISAPVSSTKVQSRSTVTMHSPVGAGVAGVGAGVAGVGAGVAGVGAGVAGVGAGVAGVGAGVAGVGAGVAGVGAGVAGVGAGVAGVGAGVAGVGAGVAKLLTVWR